MILQDCVPLPGSHLEDEGPLIYEAQHPGSTKISQSLLELEEKINF